MIGSADFTSQLTLSAEQIFWKTFSLGTLDLIIYYMYFIHVVWRYRQLLVHLKLNNCLYLYYNKEACFSFVQMLFRPTYYIYIWTKPQQDVHFKLEASAKCVSSPTIVFVMNTDHSEVDLQWITWNLFGGTSIKALKFVEYCRGIIIRMNATQVC